VSATANSFSDALRVTGSFVLELNNTDIRTLKGLDRMLLSNSLTGGFRGLIISWILFNITTLSIFLI
jgi:hypothetical protein